MYASFLQQSELRRPAAVHACVRWKMFLSGAKLQKKIILSGVKL